MSFRVTAILAAFNEEDIIGAVIDHLVAEGVQVHFLDHGSTDGTLDEARRREGRGVIGIEALPAAGTVRWADVLRRKEQLARELPGDWFIHHDADEFRESPWPGTSLAEAIRVVDGLGWNAIDFELLQFRPTQDGFRRGDDVLEAFPFYETAEPYDRAQVKCWKRCDDVAIAHSGGHDVDFEGRRVFPMRFLLRHYPVRTQEQGMRKVLHERLARFDAEEQAGGWHLQYAGIREGHDFLRRPEDLLRYDAREARARLAVDHRGAELLARSLEQVHDELGKCREDLQAVARARQEAEERLAAAAGERDRLQRELDEARVRESAERHAMQGRLAEEESRCAALREAMAALEAEALRRQQRVDELHASWSWRATAPARMLLDLLAGRR